MTEPLNRPIDGPRKDSSAGAQTGREPGPSNHPSSSNSRQRSVSSGTHVAVGNSKALMANSIRPDGLPSAASSGSLGGWLGRKLWGGSISSQTGVMPAPPKPVQLRSHSYNATALPSHVTSTALIDDSQLPSTSRSAGLTTQAAPGSRAHPQTGTKMTTRAPSILPSSAYSKYDEVGRPRRISSSSVIFDQSSTKASSIYRAYSDSNQHTIPEIEKFLPTSRNSVSNSPRCTSSPLCSPSATHTPASIEHLLPSSSTRLDEPSPPTTVVTQAPEQSRQKTNLLKSHKKKWSMSADNLVARLTGSGHSDSVSSQKTAMKQQHSPAQSEEEPRMDWSTSKQHRQKLVRDS